MRRAFARDSLSVLSSMRLSDAHARTAAWHLSNIAGAPAHQCGSSSAARAPPALSGRRYTSATSRDRKLHSNAAQSRA